MPSLGADMDEGTVIEWLVKPGDTVNKGDPMAVVDTAKAAVEVETFAGGTIEEILVPVGERVQVGTPLATIDGGEPVPIRPAEPDTAQARLEPAPAEPELAPAGARPEPPPTEPARIPPPPTRSRH